MFSVQVDVDDEALRQRLDLLREKEVPAARRDLSRRLMREVLRQTILRNPVDTARSRAAWVASLEQLGGTAPPGWRGPEPSASAIDEGRGLQELTESQTHGETEIEARSGVSYVPYLEYGTRKMAPFAMVRRSLAEMAGRLRAGARKR